MDFKNSNTKINLMRAFAGESQARNRYTFAASEAKKQNQYLIYSVFYFTACQEKEHAKIFYDHLKEVSGENIMIDAAYPVETGSDLLTLLKAAAAGEYSEHEEIYPSFEKEAKEEGFIAVEKSFKNIAAIEKIHGDRFKMYLELMQTGKLYTSDTPKKWMCLNCGHVYSGKEVPQMCPVCTHPRGYFVPEETVPYTKSILL